jgi:hypothetical protein
MKAMQFYVQLQGHRFRARQSQSSLSPRWQAFEIALASFSARFEEAKANFSSMEKFSVSHTMTDRSMTFCNSRILPGQRYD